MKNYKVNVNGTEYKVSIELISETEATAPVAAPAPAAAPAPVEAAPVAPAAAAPAGGEKVNAPMPGTILSVNVKVGDTVKKGQVLVILEAMKMENEIMSPVDGTVTFVGVNQGASVESGSAICVIE
ncbi:MAG: biotin/lipoyl-binding protein [Clostridia bacterium]|nr:biotin/lipoyl-binding protein [Clostridia bacterium]